MRPDEVERFWLDSKIRSGVGSPRKLSGPGRVVRYVSGDEAGSATCATSDANDAVRVVARIRGGRVLRPLITNTRANETFRSPKERHG